MKDYLLLLRGGDARMADMSEEETATHMQRWGQYMNNLAEKGHLVGGLPLQPGGKVLTNAGASDEEVRSEKGEVVGGYLMLKANDYDHAVELTKACPIFEHNGNVEIREVMPMEM